MVRYRLAKFSLLIPMVFFFYISRWRGVFAKYIRF